MAQVETPKILEVVFTIPRDEPVRELWPADTEDAALVLRAKHHAALCWEAKPYEPSEEE